MIGAVTQILFLEHELQLSLLQIYSFQHFHQQKYTYDVRVWWMLLKLILSKHVTAGTGVFLSH